MMANLVLNGVFTAGGGASLAGVTDLHLAQFGSAWVLYTASAQTHGLGAFSVGGGGALSALDSVSYSANSGTLGVTGLATAVLGTDRVLLPAGRYDNGLAIHDLGANGTLDTVSAPSAAPGVSLANITTVASLSIGGSTYVYTSSNGAGQLDAYRLTAGPGLSYIETEADSAQRYLGDISALATAEAYGKGFVFAASGFEAGVTVFTVGAGGALTEGESLGTAEGLGLNAPSALLPVQVGQDLFLVLAAAGTDSLSVLHVSPFARLEVADHVVDDNALQLTGVRALTSVQYGERVLVIAGGDEDGVSVFELTPRSGHLSHLASIDDPAGATLDNVTAIEALVTGTTLTIYVAGATDGVALVTMDLSVLNEAKTGDKFANTITGTAGKDLILGYGGDDVLSGWGDDDRLIDGTGADRMDGGGGADVFEFVLDNMTDTVIDFTPGEDKLDLSAIPMLYSMSSLEMSQEDWGVMISFGAERIRLLDHWRNGDDIQITDLSQDDFIFG